MHMKLAFNMPLVQEIGGELWRKSVSLSLVMLW